MKLQTISVRIEDFMGQSFLHMMVAVILITAVLFAIIGIPIAIFSDSPCPVGTEPIREFSHFQFNGKVNVPIYEIIGCEER